MIVIFQVSSSSILKPTHILVVPWATSSRKMNNRTRLTAAIAASTVCPPPKTTTITITGLTPLQSSGPATKALPSTTNGADLLTISITNRYSIQVSLSFESNVNAPSPIDDPSPTTLASAAATQFWFPRGWAGRINVGPNLNVNGSKIEGSWVHLPDVDVSYVDGYSVPITCASDGESITGCNIDLFQQIDNPCPVRVEGPVCLNPARVHDNGPPHRFFQVCAGSAYTYPNDNNANKYGLSSDLVICCIGTQCEPPVRQGQLINAALIR